MSFLKRIKQALHPENIRGSRMDIAISRRDLNDIVYHFESMDDELRTLHYKKNGLVSPYDQLKSSLRLLLRRHGGDTSKFRYEVYEILDELMREHEDYRMSEALGRQAHVRHPKFEL